MRSTSFSIRQLPRFPSNFCLLSCAFANARAAEFTVVGTDRSDFVVMDGGGAVATLQTRAIGSGWTSANGRFGATAFADLQRRPTGLEGRWEGC